MPSTIFFLRLSYGCCYFGLMPSTFSPLWGGCLPGTRPARYFCINYPSFNPGFTLPQRSPPSRPEWTATFPTKHDV